MEASAIYAHNYRGWGIGVAGTSGFQTALGALSESFDSPALGSNRDRQICPLVWEGQTYYVKHYASPTLKARLQSFVKRSKADKALHCATKLQQVGIATPRVFAYLQRGGWRNPPEHLLVTEGVEGQTLRATLRSSLSTSHRRALVRSLANFLARLHDVGVYHGDFSAFNIMVEQMDTDPTLPGWRIHLIDLDAIRSLNWISQRRQIKNLDELGRNFPRLKEVSTQDRLRFLHHYAQSRREQHIPLRELKNRVCRRTAQRMQTYGKRFIPS